MNHPFLSYYQKELDLIHELAETFAQAHPKVAGRLRLEGKHAADPDIDHLFQRFALSNAKLAYQFVDHYSFLSSALCNTLHPHLLGAMPALSIAQIYPDETKLNESLVINQHTMLEPAFRTAYGVKLFPVKIKTAEFLSKPATVPVIPALTQAESFLQLQLTGLQAKTDLSQLDLNPLRILIDLPAPLSGAFYQLLFAQCIGIAAADSLSDTKPVLLPASTLQRVGFKPEEGLLPYQAATPLPYRLLLEFFALPEKFMFFDLYLPPGLIAKKPALIFYFNHTDIALEKTLSADHLKLGCTPIVNLFEATIEKFKINAHQQAYRLQTQSEIYKVRNITVHLDNHQEKILLPFFEQPTEQGYQIIHKPAPTAVLETMLYLQSPPYFFKHSKTCEISAEVICTNAHLPAQLGDNIDLIFAESKTDKIKKIHCIKKITQPHYLCLDTSLRWQFLSSLNLNSFSLVEDALRHLLSIYIADPALKETVLTGMIKLYTQPVTIRSQKIRHNQFCQALQIHLILDEDKFKTVNLYLFMNILEHFFSAYIADNSYLILSVRSLADKTIYSGQPRRGEATTNSYQ